MNLVAKCGCVKEVPMNDRKLHRCPDHGETFVHRSALKPRKPLRRVSEKREAEVRRRGSTMKRGKGFEASPAQREKVRGLPCINCGREASDYVAIDPAHLWPRGQGGCDDPLCVGPLCRDLNGGCHRRFDEGEIDILPQLLDRGYHAEIAHMIGVHHISPTVVVERLTGQWWKPVESEAAA